MSSSIRVILIAVIKASWVAQVNQLEPLLIKQQGIGKTLAGADTHNGAIDDNERILLAKAIYEVLVSSGFRMRACGLGALGDWVLPKSP